MLRLYEAIELSYAEAPRTPNEFTLKRLSQVLKEQDLIGLFCLILHKRLFIIDDLEFVNKRQTLRQKFLSTEQVQSAAQLLNLIAFAAFQSEQKRDLFSPFFLTNLRKALSSLVSRDHRLKLFPSDFWVVDKHMAAKTENVPFQDI